MIFILRPGFLSSRSRNMFNVLVREDKHQVGETQPGFIFFTDTDKGEDKMLQDFLNFKYSSVITLKIKHEKYIADPAGCDHYIDR